MPRLFLRFAICWNESICYRRPRPHRPRAQASNLACPVCARPTEHNWRPGRVAMAGGHSTPTSPCSDGQTRLKRAAPELHCSPVIPPIFSWYWHYNGQKVNLFMCTKGRISFEKDDYFSNFYDYPITYYSKGYPSKVQQLFYGFR